MGSSSKDQRHKEKSKKHKKDKKHKKHKHRSSSSSDDSDYEKPLDVNTQLAMGRAAARATREILAYNYDLRSDLRELARQLDTGEALDISGIPDTYLRQKLETAFINMVQLKKNPAGQFYTRTGAHISVLSFLAPILEESRASLAHYAPPPPSTTTAAAATEQQQEQQSPAEAPSQKPQQPEEEPIQPQPQIGVALPPPSKAATVGPALPPQHTNTDNDIKQQQQQQQQQEEGLVHSDTDNEDDDVGPAPRRQLGPAMPPAELLQAAAQLPIAVDDDDNNDELIVGPPPPEYEEEANLASGDERIAEVLRVIKLLKTHASTSQPPHTQQQQTAPNEPPPPDAYNVLGISPTATATEIKKRYWRLSLLIHPDKCDHPAAAEAFQAVADAAQRLQDASTRKLVDDQRADAAARQEFAEQVAKLERERQWRVATGKGTAADLQGPIAAPPGVELPRQRETWMTELPAEKGPIQAPAVPSMRSQTTFSAKAPGGKRDAGWGYTPQQAAAAAAALTQGGEGAGQMAQLQYNGGGGGGGYASGANVAGGGVVSQHTAAAVDAYNSNIRGKTLVEQHAEKQKAGTSGKNKSSKKRKGGEKGTTTTGTVNNEEEDWDRTKHARRPFDREKDLQIGGGGKSANAEEMLKNLKALGSRFGTSGGRTFL